MKPSKMYTAAEAAEILGVSERTIYRALKSGMMSCHRIGQKRLRFTEEDIASMVSAQPKKTPAPKTPKPKITKL